MNRRLTIVFLVLIALRRRRPGRCAGAASRSTRPSSSSRRPMRWSSTPSANRPIYAKGADDVTPIASLTKLMTAMVMLDAGLPLDEAIAIDMDDLDFLKGTHSRLRHGRRADAARNAAAGADVVGKPRRVEPRAQLSRRHAGIRRGDERARRRALGMTQHAFHRSDRTVGAERRRRRAIWRAGSAAAEYPLIREFSTTAQPLRRGAADRPAARLQQHQHAGQGGQWDILVQQDRVHPRGRQMPGDAGDYREPAGRHRAARLLRQALRASPTRSGSSTGSKPANRWRCRPRRSSAKAKRASHRVRGELRRRVDRGQGQGAPPVARPSVDDGRDSGRFHWRLRRGPTLAPRGAPTRGRVVPLRSNSPACARVLAVISCPPSMRASSSTRARAGNRADARRATASPSPVLVTR